MTTTLQQTINRVKGLVKDDSDKLDDPIDYYDAIETALTSYSQLRPRLASQDIMTDANGEVVCASINDFDEAYLGLLQIEYPINTSGYRNLLDSEDVESYVAPSGRRLRMVIAANVTARIHYYTFHALPRDVDDNPNPAGLLTVRASDIPALCWLAASNALQMLSNYYKNTADKSTGADFVAFTTKSQEYAKGARDMKQKFDNHIEAGRGLVPQAQIVRG